MADERAMPYVAWWADGTAEAYQTYGGAEGAVRHCVGAQVLRCVPLDATAPASREGDGQPEGWRERLAEVADLLERFTPVAAIQVRLSSDPRSSLALTISAAHLRAALAAASQGEGGLADDAVKVCGWCSQEGHTTDEHHDERCERVWMVLEDGPPEVGYPREGWSPCGCTERARAALAAAPPAETGGGG